MCTPESWLLTWSALSSKASFELCSSSLKQPVLMIYYTGDNTVFPSDANVIGLVQSWSKAKTTIVAAVKAHNAAGWGPVSAKVTLGGL